MADLGSTRVFGRISVSHEAFFKDDVSVDGMLSADAFVGNGEGLTNIKSTSLSGTIGYGNLPFSSTNVSNWNTAYGWGNHASAGYALASRTISAGTGLTGGGSLAANRTLSVDSTVVRTSGNQTIGGNKTFTGTTQFGTSTIGGIDADAFIRTAFTGTEGEDNVHLYLQGVSANDNSGGNFNGGAFIRFATSTSGDYGTKIGSRRRSGGSSNFVVKTGGQNPSDSMVIDENGNIIASKGSFQGNGSGITNLSGTHSGLRAQATTKADVGLSNVPNWSGSTSTSLGTSNTVIPSQGAVKSYVDSGLSGKANTSGTYSIRATGTTKADVGLSNVPNLDFRDFGLGTSSAQTPPSNNFDDPNIAAGLYAVTTSAAGNGIPSSSGTALVMRSAVTGGGVSQLYILGNNTETTRALIRHAGNDGDYRPWRELWHSGNSDSFNASGNYGSLRARGTTKADVGLSGIPNTNGSTANFLRGDGTWTTPPNTNTTYAEITTAEIDAGTASTLRTITGRRIKYAVDTHGLKIGTTASTAKAGNWTPAAADIPNLPASKITSGTFAAARIPTLNQNTTGNAATATRLATARTLTIGSTGKTFNGSANVSWTLAEIGAAPTGRTITAGTGLTGGGSLAGNRTINFDTTWGDNRYLRHNDTAKEAETITGITNSITITGDANTYYPVVISSTSRKSAPTFVSVWKNLGSLTNSGYNGNHTNGSSSLWLQYETRNTTWDGNGGYHKTLYKSEPYATLVAETNALGGASGALTVWLRGGGTQYYITVDNPSASINVYYTATEISSSASVAPRTTLGNRGIYSTAPLGYGSLNGNASTATTLRTSRQINGTSFDGSVNITTARWGATRTFSIGNSSKSVTGGVNMSWSLSEIGAVGLAGNDTISGTKNFTGNLQKGGVNVALVNGTYSGLRAQATTKADVGLSGIPNTNGSTANFLRGDGTWTTPPNTNTVTSVRANNTGTYRTGNINLIGGSNVTVSEGTAGQFTITATNTNTTYSAGTGLSLSGTTFTNTAPHVATNLGSSGTGATRTITSSTGSNTSITYSAADVGAVPTGRTITAGDHLMGGGNLTANRTLSVRPKVQSWIVDSEGNNRLYFGNNGNTTNGMIFQLSSSGPFLFRNSANGNRVTITSGGAITAVSNITAYSDRRIKKNIQKIDFALDKVKSISGYTFDRTDQETSRQAGVIAQEVQKVLPEVVIENDDGTLSVAYGNMVGLLIEAIKEQQKQIDALKPWYKKLYEWFKEKF